jgi:thiamine-phosphate pyrophosphorylase
VTDAAVLALDDLGVRAAAIASAGASVALHARSREAPVAALERTTRRFVALARPPEAAVFVSGRPDVAAATGAHGVQLAAGDLSPGDARRVLPGGWIGRSVHSPAEAEAARREGADYVVVGNIYETASHPGRAAQGLALVTACAELGLPVIAIGGLTPERARAARDAGAWGVAAIRSLWLAPDPAAAALAMLEAWQ